MSDRDTNDDDYKRVTSCMVLEVGERLVAGRPLRALNGLGLQPSCGLREKDKTLVQAYSCVNSSYLTNQMEHPKRSLLHLFVVKKEELVSTMLERRMETFDYKSPSSAMGLPICRTERLILSYFLELEIGFSLESEFLGKDVPMRSHENSTLKGVIDVFSKFDDQVIVCCRHSSCMHVILQLGLKFNTDRRYIHVGPRQLTGGLDEYSSCFWPSDELSPYTALVLETIDSALCSKKRKTALSIFSKVLQINTHYTGWFGRYVFQRFKTKLIRLKAQIWMDLGLPYTRVKNLWLFVSLYGRCLGFIVPKAVSSGHFIYKIALFFDRELSDVAFIQDYQLLNRGKSTANYKCRANGVEGELFDEDSNSNG